MTNDGGFNTGIPQGGRHPVKKASGDVKEVIRDTRKFDARGNREAREQVYCKLQIINLKVEETFENQVWTAPIMEFSVAYTDPANSRGNNRWEAFSSSLRDLNGGEAVNVMTLKGKHIEFGQYDYELNQPDPEDPDKFILVPLPAWMITAVEGMGSKSEVNTSVRDYVLDSANGKTEAELKQFLMKPENMANLKGQAEIIDALTENSLVKTYVGAGWLSEDGDGKLHKVEATASK